MLSSPRVTARSLHRNFISHRLRSLEERVGVLVIAGAILFALSQSLWAHEFAIGDIEIEHPWSRATPPGAKVAAGYLSISNEGSSADRLIAATAEIAGKTEIHEMAVGGDGVMTMRQLPSGLDLPAGSEVALKPGSYHIMFMDLRKAPKQGEPFAGTLTFEKAGTVAVKFAVEPIGGPNPAPED